MITAPPSRFLAVADTERSVAFYRDVLGFEVQPVQDEDGFAATVEVVSGPARIQLGVAEGAFDSTGERRPRGTAILFFETDDVAGLHAAVLARGGKPSEPEKVNWIKYRMFQLQDPDGHTLWFGQSYHVADPANGTESIAERQIPRGPGQLRQMIPEFPLVDIAAGLAHYRDVLGFTVNYAQEDIGILNRDNVSIALIPRTGRHQAIGSCYVYIRDADALHAELLARGANVLDQPVSMPWDCASFTCWTSRATRSPSDRHSSDSMNAVFKNAWPYADDAMNLPVKDVEAATPFYETIMGFQVVDRKEMPIKSVVLARDGIQIGLAENGGNPEQEGCFFEVDDVEAAFEELKANGLTRHPAWTARKPPEQREEAGFSIDRHGSISHRVFFVVAPDGLCYCIGERQPLA